VVLGALLVAVVLPKPLLWLIPKFALTPPNFVFHPVFSDRKRGLILGASHIQVTHVWLADPGSLSFMLSTVHQLSFDVKGHWLRF
jgi:hypothetical protein